MTTTDESDTLLTNTVIKLYSQCLTRMISPPLQTPPAQCGSNSILA